jgi:type I restriction enzyme S subunit
MISIKKEMTLLQEYRTRLISDVVIGKMDVRNVKVPEYESVENMVVGDQLDCDNSEEGIL